MHKVTYIADGDTSEFIFNFPFFQPEQAPYDDRSIYGDTQSIQIRAPFRIHHSGY